LGGRRNKEGDKGLGRRNGGGGDYATAAGTASLQYCSRLKCGIRSGAWVVQCTSLTPFHFFIFCQLCHGTLNGLTQEKIKVVLLSDGQLLDPNLKKTAKNCGEKSR
jgi:hypothetical protein